MAEHHPGEHRLIDEYLDGLRRSIHDRPDADAVLDELRDHLLSASEHHQRAGAGGDEADRLAVEELGDADQLATSFARSDHGRPAVPTAFTRAAGIAGSTAAISAVVAGVAFGIGDRIEEADGSWSTAAQAWGTVGSIATLMATMSLLVLLVGVVRRHGALGVAGAAATGLAALATLTSVIAWAVPVWCTLAAASWVVLAVATRNHGIAPRHATALLAASLATVAAVAAAGIGSGSPLPVALDVAAIGVGAGCAVVLGRWLAAEAPVDAPHRPVATA